MPKIILPLPNRPRSLIGSPEVVCVLDRIRFALDERDDMGEFYWFAREYPRVYRHHFQHAEFRLQTIYTSFENAHKYYTERLTNEADGELFEMAVGNKNVQTTYWDFECYLSALSAALDILARICGTAFKQHAPASFKDFCKKAPEGALKEIFRKAQDQWAQQMKDYRD